MGIAQRIAELYAAKMNAVLDRVCDPRELADYSYVELQDLLTEVRWPGLGERLGQAATRTRPVSPMGHRPAVGSAERLAVQLSALPPTSSV